MSKRLPHPLFGVDYVSEIPASLLKAAGVKFVVRYVSRYGYKCLTKGEYQRLSHAGIGVAVVFEDYARNAWGGYDAGKSDGEFAKNFIADVSGVPFTRGRPMSFAVDSDTVGHPEQVAAYFQGVASVWTPHRCAPYGSKEVVSYFADRGHPALFQTYAWSGGALDTRARIWQWSNDHVLAGRGVDYDYAWYEDYGQINYAPRKVTHHYERFIDHTFKIKTRDGKVWHLNEQWEVKHHDALLLHPDKNAQALKESRHKMTVLRDRVWAVSHPNHWAVAWRWWRWQRLNARAIH